MFDKNNLFQFIGKMVLVKSKSTYPFKCCSHSDCPDQKTEYQVTSTVGFFLGLTYIKDIPFLQLESDQCEDDNRVQSGFQTFEPNWPVSISCERIISIEELFTSKQLTKNFSDGGVIS